MWFRRRTRGDDSDCSGDRSRPLRCLFVITSMPVGGAETLLVNLLRRLDPAMVRAEVVCLKEPGPLGESIAGEFPVHSRLIANKWDVSVLWRLAKRFEGADVVITVGAGDKMFWGRLAAAIARVPVILSALHSTGWPDGVGRLNRLLTPITDGFIAVAKSHGRFLAEFERFPEDKVFVIPNGVDCQRFMPAPENRSRVRSELGIGADALLVGIVAALRSEKNHSLLIRAAARLRNRFPNLHWMVVGEGPERQQIERLASDLDVCDRVHLLGTRHDTPELVAALDLFTLCSLNEAAPVSILEALACGVPVVASDVGSVSEMVIENRTGLLFPSQDLDALVDSVGRLLDDEATRSRLGSTGRAHVEQHASLESMVSGYQTLMQTLYADGFRRPRSAPAGANWRCVAESDSPS